MKGKSFLIVVLVGLACCGLFTLRKPSMYAGDIQQVHVPIRSGEVTTGVPCFAVYNDNGVLKAVTAEADMHGVLHEFNVLGGRIDPTPLPEPWRWFELNAAFSMEEP